MKPLNFLAAKEDWRSCCVQFIIYGGVLLTLMRIWSFCLLRSTLNTPVKEIMVMAVVMWTLSFFPDMTLSALSKPKVLSRTLCHQKTALMKRTSGIMTIMGKLCQDLCHGDAEAGYCEEVKVLAATFCSTPIVSHTPTPSSVPERTRFTTDGGGLSVSCLWYIPLRITTPLDQATFCAWVEGLE